MRIAINKAERKLVTKFKCVYCQCFVIARGFSYALRSTQEIKGFKARRGMVMDSIAIQLCDNGIEMFPGCMNRVQYRRTRRLSFGRSTSG